MWIAVLLVPSGCHMISLMCLSAPVRCTLKIATVRGEKALQKIGRERERERERERKRERVTE